MSPQPVGERDLGTGACGWIGSILRQGLESVVGLDNGRRIARIDQNVTNSLPFSDSQHSSEPELIESYLEKPVEEDELMLDLLHVLKEDFHPNEAGAPDQKPLGFDYVNEWWLATTVFQPHK
jgi:hypothetical protein